MGGILKETLNFNFNYLHMCTTSHFGAFNVIGILILPACNWEPPRGSAVPSPDSLLEVLVFTLALTVRAPLTIRSTSLQAPAVAERSQERQRPVSAGAARRGKTRRPPWAARRLRGTASCRWRPGVGRREGTVNQGLHAPCPAA